MAGEIDGADIGEFGIDYLGGEVYPLAAGVEDGGIAGGDGGFGGGEVFVGAYG